MTKLLNIRRRGGESFFLKESRSLGIGSLICVKEGNFLKMRKQPSLHKLNNCVLSGLNEHLKREHSIDLQQKSLTFDNDLLKFFNHEVNKFSGLGGRYIDCFLHSSTNFWNFCANLADS